MLYRVLMEQSGMRRLSQSLSHPWKDLATNWFRELVALAAVAVLIHHHHLLQLALGQVTVWVLNAPRTATAMEISSASRRSAPMRNCLP